MLCLKREKVGDIFTPSSVALFYSSPFVLLEGALKAPVLTKAEFPWRMRNIPGWRFFQGVCWSYGAGVQYITLWEFWATLLAICRWSQVVIIWPDPHEFPGYALGCGQSPESGGLTASPWAAISVLCLLKESHLLLLTQKN